MHSFSIKVTKQHSGCYVHSKMCYLCIWLHKKTISIFTIKDEKEPWKSKEKTWKDSKSPTQNPIWYVHIISPADHNVSKLELKMNSKTCNNSNATDVTKPELKIDPSNHRLRPICHTKPAH
jgi:hypothetical protein